MYTHAAIGGTFDHFHAGHKKLLQTAFEQAARVSIGIVEVSTKNKELSYTIEPYEKRKSQVETFLREQHFAHKAYIFPLKDIFGITLNDNTVDVLFCTPDTVENTTRINREREQKGKASLGIHQVPLVLAEDGTPISSSRIRRGEITRNGILYRSCFSRERFNSGIPDVLRHAVQKPMGKVFAGPEQSPEVAMGKILLLIEQMKPTMVISIGDVVTESLFRVGYTPDISIVDHMTRRTLQVKEKGYTPDLQYGPYVNPAGTITETAANGVYQILQDSLQGPKLHRELIIKGEEDLMGIPVVLMSPLRALFLYGQYEKGVVGVIVDEAAKEHYLQFF